MAIYSSFLQRAYDNIIHDVAIEGLPVTFCIDRAGLVGEDGITHNGQLDLAYLRCIPGMTIAAPGDVETLRNVLFTSARFQGPLAVRYPRGKVPEGSDIATELREIEVGKGRMMVENRNSRIAILSLGTPLHDAVAASKALMEDGIEVDVYDLIWLKPLDTELMKQIGSGRYSEIVTIEDGTTTGGFGSAVAEFFAETERKICITRLGIKDQWVMHATVGEQKSENGFDRQSIIDTVREIAGRTEK